MFQLSSRRLSAVASGVKSRAPITIRCFSSAESKDVTVDVKKKIPTYNDPVATVDIKTLSEAGMCTYLIFELLN